MLGTDSNKTGKKFKLDMDLVQKVLLKKQRDAIAQMGKDRYEFLKKFAEENVMESRKLMLTSNPMSKEELSAYNREKLERAYRHPFDRIPEEFFQEKQLTTQ